MLKSLSNISIRCIIVLVLLFGALLPVVSSQASDFGVDVIYQEAVPAFLEAITEAVAAVLTEEELQDIAAWNSANMARIEEFLDELINIAMLLEDNPAPDFIFTQYQAFIDKWNEVAATYPHFEKVEPMLTSLVNELFVDLPQLDSFADPTGNPMAPMAELYQETEETNPWGLAALWQLTPLQDDPRVTIIEEFQRERTVAGVVKIQTVTRKVVTTKDGTVVYMEIAENNNVTERFVEYGNPSLMHDILEQLEENGQDMGLIDAFKKLVKFINDNFQLAFDNNVTDECSANYVYRKELMGDGGDCTDIIDNEQDIMAMNAFDPFDQVNQVFLGFNNNAERPHTQTNFNARNIRQARHQQRAKLRQLKERIRQLKRRERELTRFYN